MQDMGQPSERHHGTGSSGGVRFTACHGCAGSTSETATQEGFLWVLSVIPKNGMAGVLVPTMRLATAGLDPITGVYLLRVEAAYAGGVAQPVELSAR